MARTSKSPLPAWIARCLFSTVSVLVCVNPISICFCCLIMTGQKYEFKIKSGVCFYRKVEGREG
ncbi:MAG: hypothetical protein EGP87_00095 [Paraprevotella clara]|nr:hypothetical protein [Paraprevotella clara]